MTQSPQNTAVLDSTALSIEGVKTFAHQIAEKVLAYARSNHEEHPGEGATLPINDHTKVIISRFKPSHGNALVLTQNSICVEYIHIDPPSTLRHYMNLDTLVCRSEPLSIVENETLALKHTRLERVNGMVENGMRTKGQSLAIYTILAHKDELKTQRAGSDNVFLLGPITAEQAPSEDELAIIHQSQISRKDCNYARVGEFLFIVQKGGGAGFRVINNGVLKSYLNDAQGKYGRTKGLGVKGGQCYVYVNQTEPEFKNLLYIIDAHYPDAPKVVDLRTDKLSSRSVVPFMQGQCIYRSEDGKGFGRYDCRSQQVILDKEHSFGTTPIVNQGFMLSLSFSPKKAVLLIDLNTGSRINIQYEALLPRGKVFFPYAIPGGFVFEYTTGKDSPHEGKAMVSFDGSVQVHT